MTYYGGFRTTTIGLLTLKTYYDGFKTAAIILKLIFLFIYLLFVF